MQTSSIGKNLLFLGVFSFWFFLHGPAIYADSSTAPFSGLDEIRFWAGSGTNRAALILQWNDATSPASIVWGYRWNGNATGFDMLQSVAGFSSARNPGTSTSDETWMGADPRLTASWLRFEWGKALDSVVFQDGSQPRHRNDWSHGFWEYRLFGGQFTYPVFDELWDYVGTATYDQTGSSLYSEVTWLSSPIGASERVLVNGSWDAWSFAANFVSAPVAAPQPAAPPPPAPRSIRLLSPLQLEMIFQTTPNLVYQLESNPDLQTSRWEPYGEGFTASNPQTVLTVAIQPQEPKRFYRLKQFP